MPELIIERVVSFSINGEPQPPFLCTPEHLDELALGHLLAQGMAALEEVASVRNDDAGVDIRLRPGASIRRASILARLAACVPGKPGFITPLADVRAMCERLLRDEAYFGAHRLMIACGGREIFREDVGRHNAADKAIAFAARSGWDFSRCALGATGRISLEMLAKAAQMGIPVFFTRKYPSDISVQWAEKLGIALVARAHTGAPDVYGDRGRVIP